MRDSYAGEQAIKAKGFDYLPATPGQFLDGLQSGQIGYHSYIGYKTRACFPSYVTDAVKGMVGVMHHKPPVIELPAAMEPMRERGTLHGESLALLLRRINEAQLMTGRIGLLLDLVPGASLPYIVSYSAETITNWDDGARTETAPQTLNLVVLNETEQERNSDFGWENVIQYRVLVLGDPIANETMGVYQQGVFREQSAFNREALITPAIRGAALDQIPFVFINATDILSEPMMPPLLGLSNVCLAIYRGEADYRQNLFMQAQDTLVVIGQTDPAKEYRLGTGGGIEVPVGGDAKFIGVSSQGLPEQRQALENDHKQAAELAGRLMDTTSRAKESGDALRIRVAAQTATLNQIALAGAEGLQTILRQGAQWIGADPAQVIVSPNLDFADAGITPAEFLQLTQAKAAGLPISEETMHSLLKENDYTEKDFAEEFGMIEQEREVAAERQAKIFNAGMLPE